MRDPDYQIVMGRNHMGLKVEHWGHWIYLAAHLPGRVLPHQGVAAEDQSSLMDLHFFVLLVHHRGHYYIPLPRHCPLRPLSNYLKYALIILVIIFPNHLEAFHFVQRPLFGSPQ